jgi:ribosome biogenesis GTPase A
LISAVSEKNKIGEETKISLKKEETVFDQIAMIDWPMVVVAVAGLYRTGKSYLMNRLAGSNKGNLKVNVSEML